MLQPVIIQLVCEDGFCEDPEKEKLARSSACGHDHWWNCMQIPVHYLLMFLPGVMFWHVPE